MIADALSQSVLFAASTSGFPGLDGFLGSRASLMLDIVFVSMFLVVAVLCWSIYHVKYRRGYQLHKSVQITLGTILLIVVVLFEIDIRLHGWQERAAGRLGGHASSLVVWALYIHLLFAISSVILWPVTIGLALVKFPDPPLPGPHSRLHSKLGWLAATDMVMTAITGWVFYCLAFVC
jgi:putative membrane protein